MPAVIFDYNGVIVDDEHLQYRAMAAVVAPFGVTLSPESYKEWCLGRPDRDGFRNIIMQFPEAFHGIDHNSLISEKTSEYQKISSPFAILAPGIQDIISVLAAEFTLGIVSGSLKAEIAPVLDQSGLNRFFAYVITAEDVTRGKPDPEGYIQGIAQLGVASRDVVVIEDTPVGITAAHGAGAYCIGVAQTHDIRDLHEADAVVPTVRDVTPALIYQVLQQA